MSEGWPDFWIKGKYIELIDTINTVNLIKQINTIDTVTNLGTLDTINTIGTVNTIDTINKIRDVTVSEERRRDAIKNGFFNQALLGWYVDYVEIQDTDDPYFIAGYDAVLTSVDSNLVQYLIPFMRKDEVYSLQIRCKGAASGTLDVMFINPSGGMSSYPLSISSSYATYTVDIPYDVVAGIWIYPTDASTIPCRIKFVSAPLKTKVYQAEKDRTITPLVVANSGSITASENTGGYSLSVNNDYASLVEFAVSLGGAGEIQVQTSPNNSDWFTLWTKSLSSAGSYADWLHVAFPYFRINVPTTGIDVSIWIRCVQV